MGTRLYLPGFAKEQHKSRVASAATCIALDLCCSEAIMKRIEGSFAPDKQVPHALLYDVVTHPGLRRCCELYQLAPKDRDDLLGRQRYDAGETRETGNGIAEIDSQCLALDSGLTGKWVIRPAVADLRDESRVSAQYLVGPAAAKQPSAPIVILRKLAELVLRKLKVRCS